MAGRPRKVADPLENDVIRAIRSFDIALDKLRTSFSHRYGITVNDTFVMSLLAGAGNPLTPTELAGELGVTTGTLTAMLDRLQRAGFITRSPNPRDRRSLLISLSPEGRSNLQDVGHAMQHSATEAIAADQRAGFAANLRALAQAIEDTAERAGTPVA